MSVRETKNCINSFLGFIAQHNSSVRGLLSTFDGFRLKCVNLNRSSTKRKQSEHLNVDVESISRTVTCTGESSALTCVIPTGEGFHTPRLDNHTW